MDIISYIFGFEYAGAAGLDPIIGPLPNNEMLLYFLNISSARPISGYQTAVVQTGPVDNTLLNHPALLLAYNLSAAWRGETSLISSVFTNDQISNLLLISTPFGPVASPLPIGGAQPTPGFNNGYITEDAAAFYVAEDGVTFYVQET